MAGRIWGFELFREIIVHDCGLREESKETPCREYAQYGYGKSRRSRTKFMIEERKCQTTFAQPVAFNMAKQNRLQSIVSSARTKDNTLGIKVSAGQLCPRCGRPITTGLRMLIRISQGAAQ